MLPPTDFRTHHTNTIALLSRYLATGEAMTPAQMQHARDLVDGLAFKASHDPTFLYHLENGARAVRMAGDRDPSQWGPDRLATETPLWAATVPIKA